NAVTALNPSDTLALSTDTKLSADGVQLADTRLPTGSFKLPTGTSTVQLGLSTSKSAAWSTTAIKTSTTWTWRSTTGSGTLPAARLCPDGGPSCAFQPLLFADYATGADATNALPAGVAASIGIRVHHQPFE